MCPYIYIRQKAFSLDWPMEETRQKRREEAKAASSTQNADEPIIQGEMLNLDDVCKYWVNTKGRCYKVRWIKDGRMLLFP